MMYLSYKRHLNRINYIFLIIIYACSSLVRVELTSTGSRVIIHLTAD